MIDCSITQHAVDTTSFMDVSLQLKDAIFLGLPKLDEGLGGFAVWIF